MSKFNCRSNTFFKSCLLYILIRVFFAFNILKEKVGFKKIFFLVNILLRIHYIKDVHHKKLDISFLKRYANYSSKCLTFCSASNYKNENIYVYFLVRKISHLSRLLIIFCIP